MIYSEKTSLRDRFTGSFTVSTVLLMIDDYNHDHAWSRSGSNSESEHFDFRLELTTLMSDLDILELNC